MRGGGLADGRRVGGGTGGRRVGENTGGIGIPPPFPISLPFPPPSELPLLPFAPCRRKMKNVSHLFSFK
jgi:hypothetical protein